jgi:amino acid adenylation domain-containing protein/non-ribosomal peptide synthase protein (TIGR01720 family)
METMKLTQIRAFIQELEQKEIYLFLEAGSLKIRSKAAIDPQTLEQLKQNKSRLIEFLSLENQNIYELSFSQSRLWFLDQYEHQESTTYNESALFSIDGALDIAALEKSFQEVIARHESLRTNFIEIGEEVVQVIAPSVEFNLQLIPADTDTMLEKVYEEIAYSFDLNSDRLFNVLLFEIAPNQYKLFINIHHIISDGWSVSVMVGEIGSLYASYITDRSNSISPLSPLSPLTPLTIQYADYALWQREYLSGDLLDKKMNYWKEELKDLDTLELPLDPNHCPSRPLHQTFKGQTLHFSLDADIKSALETINKQYDVTMFMTLLGAFNVLLHKYSNQSDIAIGSPIANRATHQIEPLIGMFVNTLVLRSKINNTEAFEKLLSDIKHTTLNAYEHQDVPFEKIVDALEVQRDTSRSPLFQVMFILQNNENIELNLEGLETSFVELERGIAKFDMTLSVTEETNKKTGFTCALEYNSDLFTQEAMQRVAQHFKVLLQDIIHDPKQKISDLKILTPKEEKEILIKWNDTQSAYPKDKTLHALFEEQVQKNPHSTAVIFEDQTLTYEELNNKANQLAHYLIEQDIKPDDLIAIKIHRSLEMMIGLLGILKAGAAYVPIDPSYPQERIDYMIEDSEAKVILTTSDLEDKITLSDLNKEQTKIVSLDSQAFKQKLEDTKKYKITNPKTNVKADNLAYVIYTSGSTGKPKGVMLEHRTLNNFLTSMANKPGLTHEDALLAVTAISFDIHTLELYLPLINGAQLIIASREAVKDPYALEAMLHETDNYNITIMQATPATFKMLLSNKFKAGKALKILCGGEAIPPSLKEELLSSDMITLWNMYGPTETTVWSTVQQLQKDKAINVGQAIANTRLYILDEQLEPTPCLTAGELYIAGECLARGYLKRQELTDEKFIHHPKFGRLYQTGDSARFLANGEVEYLGRLDDQIKLRGFRIELGEIESCINVQENIKEAVVLLKTDKGNADEHLAAYLTLNSKKSSDVSALKEALRKVLPEFMIPSVFITLDALPLTPNKKIDRKALGKLDIAPELSKSAVSKKTIAPRTPLENDLCEIFKAVLNLKEEAKISIEDNFFEMGGHSLLATTAVSKIRHHLGISIALKTFFAHPDIKSLALHIKEEQSALADNYNDANNSNDPNELVIQPRDPKINAIPLSFTQERLWFLDQYEAHQTNYNISALLKLQGDLHSQPLEQALQTIIRRHESLRTNFIQLENEEQQEGQARQIIHEHVNFELICKTLQKKKELDSAVEEELKKSFDLSKDLLFRAVLFKIKSTHYLFVNMHHIISDGWSSDIIVQELITLYSAYLHNNPNPLSLLSPLEIQYADYALWQREYLNGDLLDKKMNYWKEELKDLDTLELPLDPNHCPSRPLHQTFKGQTLHFSLDADIKSALETINKQYDVTMFMTLLGAFNVLLHKYSNQSDIAIGSPIANRATHQIEPLIGMFVNTLVLRSKINNTEAFEKLLSDIKHTTLNAYEHQDVPFEKIVDALEVQRDTSRSPLFQVMFILQNNENIELNLEGLETSFVELERGIAKFDMTLSVTEETNKKTGFTCALEYNSDLFTQEAMQRVAQHFKVLLQDIIHDPKQKISDLKILTPKEEKEILIKWNDTQSAYPKDKTLHALFEEQVQKNPHSTAVIFEDQTLTYEELNNKANQLAHYLIEQDIKPDDLIAIKIHRSLEMMIGLLGILKAGAAYVPIDPSYPQERIDYMIEDSEAKVILTTSDLEDKITLSDLNKEQTKIVSLDSQAFKQKLEDTKKYKITNPKTNVKADNLAYVIYTSGSTGKPKGVMLEHQGVVNRIDWMQKEYALHADEIILQKTPFSFDVSVWELFLPVMYGLKLVFAKPQGHKDNDYLIELIQKEQVTFLHFVPSMLSSMLHTQKLASCCSIKNIVCSGEALPYATVEEFYKQTEEMTLHNLYGPTEASIDVTSYVCPKSDASRIVPIGKAIANTKLYILDENLYPVPTFSPGELHIGGECLARGYLNRPDLTQEKFINHPKFNRLYKTGDLTRFLADGNIEYLGRLDDQVKLRGFRIELGEIETQIRQYKGIKEAVVLLKTDNRTNSKRLTAYITVQEEQKAAIDHFKEDMRKSLKKTLPEFMIPSIIHIVDKLPLSPNGKVDKKALLKLEIAKERSTAFTKAENEIEEHLLKVFKKVLHIDPSTPISTKDNFFELGGDSILSIQVVTQLRKLGFDISVKEIFTHQNSKELASLLKNRAQNNDRSNLVIPQEAAKGDALLNPIAHWFFEQNFKKADYFNQSALFTLDKRIDKTMLASAWLALMHKHDTLRLQYKIDSQTISAYYLDSLDPLDQWNTAIESIDLSSIKTDKLNQKIEKEIAKAQKSFKLGGEDYLFKILWIQTPANKMHNRLFLVFHHLIIDGVSWRIITEDLVQTLEALMHHQTPQLGLKTSSFQSYSQALQAYASSQTLIDELPYWQNIVNKINNIDMDHHAFTLSDRLSNSENKKDENKKTAFHEIIVSLKPPLTHKLLTQANLSYRTQTLEILLTALALTLQKNGNNSAYIQLESHGRQNIIPDIDLSQSIGWFTALYPCFLKLDDIANLDNINNNIDLDSAIKTIKETLRTIPHNGLHYGILKYLRSGLADTKTLKIRDDVPSILFNYLGQFDNVSHELLDLAPESSEISIKNVSDKNKKDAILEINAQVINGALECAFLYSQKDFKNKTVKSFGKTFIQELENLIDYVTLPNSIGFSPSDFKLAQLNQKEIDTVIFKNKEEMSACEDIYPLSPVQEGMFFHALKDRDSQAYKIQLQLDILTDIDVKIFEQALGLVIQNHSILRTSFIYENLNQVLQKVHKRVKTPFSYEDISDNKKKIKKIKHILIEEKEKSFDMEQAPLFRLKLLKRASKQYTLIWTVHHIITDGWSNPLFFEELFIHYEALSLDTADEDKQDNKKDKNPDNYKDFISYLSQINKAQEEAFWSHYLQGFKSPTKIGFIQSQDAHIADNEANSKHKKLAKRISLELSQEEYRAIEAFIHRHPITLNTLMQVCWGIILRRYSGEKDILFGAVSSGRPAELNGVESKIGLFINTLPLRIRFDDDISVLELMRHIQDEQVHAREYQSSSLAQIQKLCALQSGENLFDSIMAFENFPISQAMQENRLLPIDNDHIKFHEETHYPLSLVIDASQTLNIAISYDSARFSKHAVQRVLNQIHQLLAQITFNPKQAICDLSIITPKEQTEMLETWNDTAVDYSLTYPKDSLIHELFEAQVEKTPKHTAVIYQDERLSYQELNQKANQLAHYLMELGLRPEDLCAIKIARSSHVLVALLAVLKSGAAYVPIDASYPKERIDYMIKDSGAKIILTTSDLESKISKISPDTKTIAIDSLEERFQDTQRYPRSNPKSGVKADNLVYVIYTSGSTGNPKGVMIEHRNLNNYLYWALCEFMSEEGWAAPVQSSIAFDATITSIFLPILCGKAVIFIPEREEIEELAKVLKDSQEKMSLLKITPSHLEVLNHQLSPEQMANTTEALVIGGEALLAKQLEPWLKHAPDTRLINEYGPTETVVGCSIYDAKAQKIAHLPHVISIGKPIANTKLYILDEHLNPVPILSTGELHIGGEGLARGYLNRPDLTQEKFITHPKFGRLYKTGDLARYLDNHDKDQDTAGNIEYLGRLDDQVKLRGFRIELGEIENRLNNLEGVKESVVLLKSDKEENKSLAAFVTMTIQNTYNKQNKQESQLDIQAIKESLKKDLPDFMIPSAFVQVDKLPLTPNGKIDRKALHALDVTIRSHETFIAPKSELEKQLVQIFKTVLGFSDTRQLSILDNFFELGGHSLKAIQLISKINALGLGYSISIKDIFQYPTIEALSAKLSPHAANNKEKESNLESLPLPKTDSTDSKKYHDLTYGQKGLFILSSMNQDLNSYNMFINFELEGKLDKKALKSAFTMLIQKHEILRTQFISVEGEPKQRVLELESLDFKIKEKEIKESELQKEIDKNDTVIFDLALPPLFKIKLLKLSSKRHVVLFSLHHILSDGWSLSVIARDLEDFYNCALENKAKNCLPEPLAIQYRDYAAYQNLMLEHKILKDQQKFWLNQFKDYSNDLELPTDFERPQKKSFKGDALIIRFNKKTSSAFRKAAKKQKQTLFAFLLSVIDALLYFYSKNETIVIGTPTNSIRSQERFANQIGYYLNTVAIKSKLQPQQSFAENFKNTAADAYDSLHNSDYPFDKLVQDLNISMQENQNPLFSVMVILQNFDEITLDLKDLNVIPLHNKGVGSKFDLKFEFIDEEQIELIMEYSLDLFKEETIINMKDKLLELFDYVLEDMSMPLYQLEEKLQLNQTLAADMINVNEDIDEDF